MVRSEKSIGRHESSHGAIRYCENDAFTPFASIGKNLITAIFIFTGKIFTTKNLLLLSSEKSYCVFQNYALYRHLNVMDNITLALCSKFGHAGTIQPGESLRAAKTSDMARIARNTFAIIGRPVTARRLRPNNGHRPRIIYFWWADVCAWSFMTREVECWSSNFTWQWRHYIKCVTMIFRLRQTLSDNVTFLNHGKIRAEGAFTDLPYEKRSRYPLFLARHNVYRWLVSSLMTRLEQLPLVVDGIKETCKLALIVSITGFVGNYYFSEPEPSPRGKAITRLLISWHRYATHSYSIWYLLSGLPQSAFTCPL